MADNGFTAYILDEVLRDIAGINHRRMFGGYGLYKDGIIFGMIINDTLFFKLTPKSKILFNEFDTSPFTYTHTKSGKTVIMPYFEVPEEIIENKNTLNEWVDASVAKK